MSSPKHRKEKTPPDSDQDEAKVLDVEPPSAAEPDGAPPAPPEDEAEAAAEAAGSAGLAEESAESEDAAGDKEAEAEGAAADEDEEPAGAAGEGEAPARRKRRRGPRVENPAEARAVLECLLFATIEPLTLRQLYDQVRPLDEKTVRALLVELQNEYDRGGSGLQIVEVAGGWQMATRPRYAEWLEPFQKRKRRTGLTVAMLETLAIIAYKQPIIRAEIDAIRGVDSSGTVHALLELELIEAQGQKQVPGRPFLYGTTQAFLKHFGLKSLSELPSIDALRERFDILP